MMSVDDKMIRAILSKTIGKKEVDMLLNILLNDGGKFEAVFQMIFSTNKKIAWHAAWIIEKVSKRDARFFPEEKNLQLINFVLSNKHPGLQRLCFTILFYLPVCQPVSVEFINLCFEQMLSPRESVGVQVLSMKILRKIGMIEKDFIPELIASLENADDNLYSPGFLTAKTNVIKSLINNRLYRVSQN
ncbi:MAG: hypothetical protein ACYC2P_04795 [Paludibacteraceae bacterium]